MTREEAIQWLNDRKTKYLELTRRYPSSSQLMLTTQVIDMAIEALQADAVSREDGIPCPICNGKGVIKRSLDVNANVVEVVRCKDCKYANKSMVCAVHLQPRLPSDFCNYGERKEP